MMPTEVESAAPTIDELAREGARRMLVAALETEVEDYVAGRRHERDEEGRALVVRNGKANERTVVCGAGAMLKRPPRPFRRVKC